MIPVVSHRLQWKHLLSLDTKTVLVAYHERLWHAWP